MIKKLDSKRVAIIHKAVKMRGSTTAEIAEIIGNEIPSSTLRLYCREMEKQGMLELIPGTFPASYKPIAKRNWPVVINKQAKELKVSRDNVEALVKILSAETEPDSTELVNLTYRLMRELKTEDKIRALAQFYKEIHDAIAEILDR